MIITLDVAAPFGTINGIAILENPFAYANDRGYDVEPVNWALLESGVLPNAA